MWKWRSKNSLPIMGTMGHEDVSYEDNGTSNRWDAPVEHKKIDQIFEWSGSTGRPESTKSHGWKHSLPKINILISTTWVKNVWWRISFSKFELLIVGWKPKCVVCTEGPRAIEPSDKFVSESKSNIPLLQNHPGVQSKCPELGCRVLIKCRKSAENSPSSETLPWASLACPAGGLHYRSSVPRGQYCEGPWVVRMIDRMVNLRQPLRCSM